MVVIRLQRGGANKRPFYHLVVADSRRAASGKFLERVGFYDPKAPAGREALRVNMERVGVASDKDFEVLMDRSVKRMFDQLKATMIASLPDFFESMSRAYAHNFSPEDLNAILNFVRTPAGQHYFQRAPLIMKDPDVQAASQRMMAQLLAKKPELDRENKQDIETYIASKAKHGKAGQPKTAG